MANRPQNSTFRSGPRVLLVLLIFVVLATGTEAQSSLTFVIPGATGMYAGPPTLPPSPGPIQMSGFPQTQSWQPAPSQIPGFLPSDGSSAPITVTLIGLPSLGTTVPPQPPPFEFGLDRYVVKPGDSLSKIARALWGNALMWPMLYGANRNKIENPNLIYPGQVLVIPRMAPNGAMPPGIGPSGYQASTGLPFPGQTPGSYLQPPQLSQTPIVSQKGGVTTRSPQFPAWFQEATSYAQRSWRFPTVTNKYGQVITHADYLKAILYIESRGRHTNSGGRVIGSSAGAQGFMQLMPATARSVGVDPSDPRQNLLGGVGYLAQVFNNTPATRGVAGDSASDILVKAAAGYNKGPYSKDLANQSWNDFVRTSRVSETVRYGITLKMALGLQLTPTEQVWIARDQRLSSASVPSYAVQTYQRAHSVA